MSAPLGWSGIVRLGLVQAALGAVVVMTTTTLNRVMVVELALPAVVPGGLVATHYAVQMLRPRWGHGADGAGRRTPWILGGLATLALGGFGAALSVALMSVAPLPGLAAAVVSYGLVGLGVGAAGTSLLALAATRVAPERRSTAAAILWIMMIAGFAVTAGVAGGALSPFSYPRLVAVMGCVSAVALGIGALAMAGLEGAPGLMALPGPVERAPFGAALRLVWAQPAARRFALFVFASTLAYGSQELVLDPFAGRLLGLTPAETTRLSGLQHGGALVGMLAVALAGAVWGRRYPGLSRACAMAGCGLSGVVLLCFALAGGLGASGFPLRPVVALLGFGNGAFAVSAIGAMLALAGADGPRHAGLRMGLFGGAQALAFGLGAVAAPGLVDLVTALVGSPAPAYAAVFATEAALFLFSARLVVAAVPSGTAWPARAPLIPVTP
ncbi:MAG: BCD family MFS transporter [Janthinobacterium lividum]